MVSDYEFHAAVQKACDAAGIVDDWDYQAVAMYCIKNGYGCADLYGTALSTLELVLGQPEGLAKVVANQSPWDEWGQSQ